MNKIALALAVTALAAGAAVAQPKKPLIVQSTQDTAVVFGGITAETLPIIVAGVVVTGLVVGGGSH
jgi:hypothetical protein